MVVDDGTTRHGQGALSIDAAAVHTGLVAGYRAACNRKGGALVDVDAAAMLRKATGDRSGSHDFARIVFVLYGQMRVFEHFYYLTISVFG